MRYTLVLLLIMITVGLFAQETIDQHHDVTKTKEEKKWKVLAGFDAHRSFFSGRPVRINGLRLGAKYKDIHRFGIGFYSLRSDVVFTDIKVDRPDATDTSYLKFDVGFATLFYEYAFYKTKRWELAVPSYIGSGNVGASYTDTGSVYQPLLDRSFFTMGSGMSAQFKIIRWFGLKAGVGYRLAFNEDKVVSRAFRGPYYKYGISIFLGELWNVLFRRDRLKPW